MTTADEILASELGFENVWFEVDLEDRVIRIPKGVTNLGVKSDEDVKHVRFKMPRVYHDSDLSTFKIGIDYTNAEGEPDRYEPTDIAIAGDLMTFTWVVGRHAAIYNGNVTFSLCCKKTDSAGNVIKELHTTDAVLPILKGTETCEFAIVEHTDLLEQWREQLFGAGESAVYDIDKARADALVNINNLTANQMSNIEAKTAASLETIPGDYTETYNNARNALRTRANAIVETTQGEIVTITDASDDYLRGMRVFGKSTQLSTTGTQLFDGRKIPSRTVNGIILTNDGTGIITLNGTATAPFSSANIIITDLPPGTYYVSGQIDNRVYFFVRVTLADGTFKYYKAPQTMTIDGTETEVLGYIYGPNAKVTFENEKIYPMLNAGTAPCPWESYSHGVASPSPNFPQPINSVDNPRVDVWGKNLLKLTTGGTAVNVTETVNDGKVSFSGTATGSGGRTAFKRGPDFMLYPGIYTLKMNVPSGTAPQGCLTQSNKADVVTGTLSSDPTQPKTFIVPEPISVYFGFNYLQDVTYDAKDVTVQIERGDTATDYVDARDIQTITLDHTLFGFPVTSGGNYTDSDGQQWICDEVDFEREIYIQRIGRLTLTGDLAWGKYNWQTYNYGFSVGEILEQEGSRQPGICNQFAIVGAAGNGVDCVWVGVGNRTVYVITEEWYNLGTDAWKAHLNETPLEIAYVLATPVITELTESELYTFSQLHSNYPNTVVLNDSGAHMAVSYNADTKTYFTRSRASDEQVQAAVDAWLTARYASAEGVSF